MSTNSGSVLLESHLQGVAEQIDQRLRSDYGKALLADFSQNLCPGCSKRLGEPVRKKVAIPFEAAAKLMCKAAGTKLAVPAAPRWELESELKPKLKKEFLGYVQDLLGECSCITGLKRLLLYGLWYALSADPDFMIRFIEAYEPYSGRTSLGSFREGFLRLCIERGIETGAEALRLIAEYTQRATGSVN